MKEILIYADTGVWTDSLAFLQEALNAKARLCTARDLLTTDWEEKTSLLIIPGGRDTPYHEKLSPGGTKRIAKFVTDGGKYLGICAGAYFGAREIVFEEGGKLEVCGTRDLSFFPGRAVGPAYGNGKFRYGSDDGAEAAHVLWKFGGEEITCRTFFNGGCLFENTSSYPHVKVIGQYVDLPDNPAAAICCKIGKGKALLSGVHVEYSAAAWMTSSPQAEKNKQLLLECEEKRLRCFNTLLRELEF